MKTAIKISALFIMFVVTILSIMDINFVSQVKSEMNDNVEISMRNVLQGKKINPMYTMSSEDMEIELIRNIGVNTNTDSDLTVNIISIDENGLIDLSLKSNFYHTNGKEDSRTIRKTMIVEQYEK